MASPRGSLRRRLLALFLGLTVSLLVVEGGLRLRQWMRYGTTETTFYRLALDAASGLMVPVPGNEVGAIRINSHGFRGPELEDPKPAGRLRLGFLGGSTTFCAEVSSQELVWPHLVTAGLAAQAPDVSFDYANASSAGYSTGQSLPNLVHRLAPLEPDVIFIYHATNDLTQDTREQALEAGRYRASEPEVSGLGRYWFTWFLLEKNLRFRARRGGHAEAHARLELDEPRLAREFRARLTTLVEEARRTAPLVCLITFSQRTRRELGPEERLEASNSSLYYMPYLDVEALIRGFELYNQVIREVARDTGCVLVEGEHLIPADKLHFNDSVHFRDAGSRRQAERVLAGLRQSEEFAALVERKRLVD